MSISIAVTVYRSHSKVSKSSPRKMRTAFCAGLRTAENAKPIAKEIGFVEKQGRPETTKHETKVKDKDTRARSVIGDVYMGQRIMRKSERLWTIS